MMYDLQRRKWKQKLYEHVCKNTINSQLEKYVKPRGYMIDVGANSGYQTVWHAQYNNVISYEPVPELCNILKENLQLLKINNVITKNFAVGNKNEIIDLYVDVKRLSMTSQIPLVDNVKKIEVPMICLDDEEKNLPINFIKIDVEGYELNVLEGSKNITDEQRPTFMVEIYKPWCVKTNISIDKYFEWFDVRNYKCMYYSCVENKMIDVDSVDHGVFCVEEKHNEHDGDFLFVDTVT